MHSSNIKFRRASEMDLDVVVKLWMDSSRYHKELDSRLVVKKDAPKHLHTFYSKLILDENNYLAVALVNDVIIGYICVLIQERPPIHLEKASGFLDGIFVKPDYRHQGVGTELYQMALRWLKEHEIRSVRLTVSPHNSVGLSFWRKQGFTELMYLLHIQI